MEVAKLLTALNTDLLNLQQELLQKYNMTSTKPEVIPNGLYNQKQAAAALGVDRHTVARYEANGLIAFRVRKAGRQKVTTGEEIVKCWQAMYL